MSALNSFAMIFGHCVWVPPSPKAALAALNLFYGLGIGGEPDVAALEGSIAAQYVAAGESQAEADKEIVWLNACFATYEVPPENKNRQRDPDAQPRQLRQVEVLPGH